MVRVRTLLILLGLATVAVGLATCAWQRMQPPRVGVAVEGEELLPRLAAWASRVARIEITRGKDTLVLNRTDDGWVVGEAAYPVQPREVRKLLLSLARLRKVRPMTERPGNYAFLAIDDPAPGSSATRVVLKDGRGTVVADVIAGREEMDRLGSGTEAQFVRLTGEKRGWLVEGVVRAPVLMARWIDTRLLKVPVERVARIEITHEDGERLVLERDAKAGEGDPPLTLLDAPATARVSAPKVRALLNSLADISLADVRKRRVAPAARARATLTMDEGLKVRFDVARDGETWWVRPSLLAEGSDAALARALRRRFAGREFAVYDSVGERLASRLDGVIEARVEKLDGPRDDAAEGRETLGEDEGR